MAFFLNNQPSEQDAAAASPAPSHSARTKPLFKQDTTLPDSLSGQHISLSAYISKHLQEGAVQARESQVSTPSGLGIKGKTPARQEAEASSARGQYLNQLDVEMAASLEQYLPTPIFRLRVMKKRLDDEIANLRLRLNKYERLPEQSLDLQDSITAVRARLAVLEAHERQVSQELAEKLAFGPVLYGISKQAHNMSAGFRRGASWLGRMLALLLYGQQYLEIEVASHELRSLQELFAERMHDNTCSGAELSQILNRYEQAAQHVQTVALQVKTKSFPARLWQELQRLVK